MTPSLFDLSGRRALVTGGSVSIGRAIALTLADAGATVAIHASPAADAVFGMPEAARETQAEIEAAGGAASVVEGDFTLPGAAALVVREAQARLGGLDILVVCASVQRHSDFYAVTPDDIAWQVAVNFNATVELLQSAVPEMVERGWGRVLSIGSINQTRPAADLSIYAALKAAQHNLILGLAAKHAAQGVTFNTLSPGLVATERNKWRRDDAETWARLQKRVNPMGRAGLPQDMAGAALLLCSDASAFITGADLQATGGHHL